MHFEVSQSGGAVLAAGTFGEDQKAMLNDITITASLLVNVGIDLDLDGSFDDTEVTHSFTVQVLSLADAKFESRRSAGGPIEPGFFEINPGEQHEALATFRFKVTGAAIADHPMLRFGVFETTGRAIVNEANTEVSATFNEGDDLGDAAAFVYVDSNQNAQWDPVEPSAKSAEFKIVKLRVLTFDIDVPNDDPNSVNPNKWSNFLTTVPAAFDQATNIVRRKDHQDDFRAAVRFEIGERRRYDHDPFNGRDTLLAADPSAEAISGHIASPGHIIFVESIAGPTKGMLMREHDKVFIEYPTVDSRLPATIAHEIGHTVGLRHAGHGSEHLMADGLGDGRWWLKRSDADAFLNGTVELF